MLLDTRPGAIALTLGGYGRSHAAAIRSIFAALNGARFAPRGGEAKASTRLLVEAYAAAGSAVRAV